MLKRLKSGGTEEKLHCDIKKLKQVYILLEIKERSLKNMLKCNL